MPQHRNHDRSVFPVKLFLFQEAGILMFVLEAFVVPPPRPVSWFYWCFHVHMEAEETLLL